MFFAVTIPLSTDNKEPPRIAQICAKQSSVTNKESLFKKVNSEFTISYS